MEIDIGITHEIGFSINDYTKHLKELRENSTGVYVFFDEYVNALYVGKSKNLFKRVPAHINGTTNTNKLVGLARTCVVYFISNYAMADIYETHLINELKPLLNIDKATYADFVKLAEDELAEVMYNVEELRRTIAELEAETDTDDLGEALYIVQEIKRNESLINVLKAKEARLKRRGAKPLINRTLEEIIAGANKARSGAVLAQLYSK